MLFKEDALFYADQVKKGEVAPLELVDQALENINSLNPKLNAVLAVYEDQAREEAKQQTATIEKMTPDERQDLPTFFGVPALLKELGQSLKGTPATSASKLLKDKVSDLTDNFAKQFQGAGFIVIGRTNVPEFGYKGISDSKYYGPVESPIKAGYNPGGSSGGAAAALKSGMVPLVAASDGGGSIRIPASHNGLIGLKPSRGRIPSGPGSYRSWHGAAVSFALTKSVRDTWALIKAMQTEQFESPFTLPTIKEDDLSQLDRPLKIAYSLEGVLGRDLSDHAKEAILQTKNNLEALGHELVEDKPDLDMEKILKSYYKMNSVDTKVLLDDVAADNGRPIEYDDVEPLTWLMYQAGGGVTAADLARTHDSWDQITAKVTEFLNDYDAILYPISNGPSPKQGQYEPSDGLVNAIMQVDQMAPQAQQDLIWDYFDESNHYLGFNVQVNLAGQTSIALPMYENEDGMPIGVQLWSQKGAEYLLLQVAQQLEDAGYVSVSIVE